MRKGFGCLRHERMPEKVGEPIQHIVALGGAHYLDPVVRDGNFGDQRRIGNIYVAGTQVAGFHQH